MVNNKKLLMRDLFIHNSSNISQKKSILFLLFLLLFILSNNNNNKCQAQEEENIDDYIKVATEKCEGNNNKNNQNLIKQINSTTTTNINNINNSSNVTTIIIIQCPAQFDKILCWPQQPADTVAEQECPSRIPGFAGVLSNKGFARRKCMPDGKWQTRNGTTTSYTDYSECVVQNKVVDDNEQLDIILLKKHIPVYKLLTKIGHGLSALSLLLAIVILSGLKRLHCARNILHINLFVSFLLFSILHLIKELFWVQSLGFVKDVVKVKEDEFRMNENVSVSG